MEQSNERSGLTAPETEGGSDLWPHPPMGPVGAAMERFFSLGQTKTERDQGGGQAVDLFGMPVVPLKDPRGRKRYAVSKENQQVVVTLRANGWTHERIAGFIGCDAKTLREYYSRELAFAGDYLEGMALQVLAKRAMEGHLPALRELLAKVQAENAPKAKVAAPAKVPVKGKKDQQAEAAREAPQEWGDLLPRMN